LGTGYIVSGALFLFQLPFLLRVKAMGLEADAVGRPSDTLIEVPPDPPAS
jgi:hypothetical protein